MARSYPILARARAVAGLMLLVVLATSALGQERPRESPLERLRKLTAEERLRVVQKVVGAAVFAPVKRGNVDVALVERGQVDAADWTDLTARMAASIRWIIEDGTRVKKGDRLVVLDDSALRDHLAVNQILLDRAMAARKAAVDNLALMRKRSLRDLRAAQVALQAARLAFKRFTGKDADEKELLRLKVEHATLSVETAELEGKAQLNRAEDDVRAREEALKKEMAAREAIQEKIAACTLLAPRDGMAVYHASPAQAFRGGAPVVAVGEPVREGQKLIRISNLERFILTARVHEALISRVRVGDKGRIRIDAFPGREVRGVVKSVARMANQQDWLTTGVKVYPVDFTLDGGIVGLKPGMTAEVRIDYEHRANVLNIPIDALVQRGGQMSCFVRVGNGLEERSIKTGVRGKDVIEVTGGLAEADLVLRSPQATAAKAFDLPPARRPRERQPARP